MAHVNPRHCPFKVLNKYEHNFAFPFALTLQFWKVEVLNTSHPNFKFKFQFGDQLF